MEQNRFRSPVVWSSIAALIVGLLMQVGLIGDAENKQIMEIVGTVLELLCVVGILNNPVDKNHF
jgi:uncharacterized membrane protein